MLSLFADTDMDVTLEEAKEKNIHLISMPYIIAEEDIYPYVDWKSWEPRAFYDMLRKGTIPKTCGLSPAQYIDYFEPEFKKGNDILYVHFSATMSGTFGAMNIALNQLKETYPERKFYEIDTKASRS